jgi:hypothetical protein
MTYRLPQSKDTSDARRWQRNFHTLTRYHNFFSVLSRSTPGATVPSVKFSDTGRPAGGNRAGGTFRFPRELAWRPTTAF